jgi:Flp pilus assembly protein TadD
MGSRKKAKKASAANPKQLHEQGVALYREGRMQEALKTLHAALRLEENSERWNDWAAVQHALGSAPDAEQGFRKALELDKNNQQAAANLGALLVELGRYVEAAPFLVVALNTTDAAHRTAVEKLIARISQAAKAAVPVANQSKE